MLEQLAETRPALASTPENRAARFLDMHRVPFELHADPLDMRRIPFAASVDRGN